MEETSGLNIAQGADTVRTLSGKASQMRVIGREQEEVEDMGNAGYGRLEFRGRMMG